MTVKELKEKLNEFDENLPIAVQCSRYLDWYPPSTVKEEVIDITNNCYETPPLSETEKKVKSVMIF